MKKLLIAFFVIFTFGFYVVYQNSGDNALPTMIPPTQAAVPVATSSAVQSNPPAPVSGPTPPTPSPATATLNPPTPSPAPKPTPSAAVPPTPPKPRGLYANGSYVGSSADAYYGYVQVKAIIQNGKIADVQFLDHPQDRRTSEMINNYAMPYLTQEAIQAQSANVDGVSGATDTSMAFRESLASALAQAKN